MRGPRRPAAAPCARPAGGIDRTAGLTGGDSRGSATAESGRGRGNQRRASGVGPRQRDCEQAMARVPPWAEAGRRSAPGPQPAAVRSARAPGVQKAAPDHRRRRGRRPVHRRTRPRATRPRPRPSFATVAMPGVSGMRPTAGAWASQERGPITAAGARARRSGTPARPGSTGRRSSCELLAAAAPSWLLVRPRG